MKRKSTVNRLYTRPVLTKGLKTPNELSFQEPVNPLLKTPLENGQLEQVPLSTEEKDRQEEWFDADEEWLDADKESKHGI